MNLKSKLILVVMVVTATLNAWAFFPVNPMVQVTPLQVSAQVYNPYYEPIACSGQVFGRTSFGQVATAFFPQQVIPAGQFRFAYVYTNIANPFINGWGTIWCNFLRPF